MDPVEIYVLGSKFKVHSCGKIERWMKSGCWKIIENCANHKAGYNVIMIQKNQFTRARLIAYSFLGMNMLSDKSIIIHHKDNDRLNCNVSNLSIESYSSINFYRKDTKGFYKKKDSDVYTAMITKNGITRRIGNFKGPNGREEAHQAYLAARNELLNC
jgi:hypothetical protein